MNLDEPARFAEVDLADALGDVEATPAQWTSARDLAGGAIALDGVSAVVVTGMGGSGICGDVVAALAADRLAVPVIVHKGYGLPTFVDESTVLLAVSYSGNTEETLSAVDEGLARGAQLHAITSGGALAERCRQRRLPLTVVPGGGQPRHSLGYLVVPALVALGLDHGLEAAIALQRQVVAQCDRRVATAGNPAKRLATRLASGGVPLVFGGQGLGAVAAYRLKCQLNENAKLPALWAVLPELDHNEVVAWQERSALTGASGLVSLRDPVGEHPRVSARFSVTEQVLADGLAWHESVVSRGTAPLARLASLFALVDLASVYTALALDHDPTPVTFIDRLKAELGG